MRTTSTATSAGSARHSPETGRNQPLRDVSEGFEVEHPVLDSLGLRRETLDRFGVGFFTGEGVLRDRVLLPFHDQHGLLIAYAGYSPKDRSIRYSKRFHPQRELYNVMGADIAESAYDGLVFVTELLNVLRLYELGVHRVVGFLPIRSIRHSLRRSDVSSVTAADWTSSLGHWNTATTFAFSCSTSASGCIGTTRAVKMSSWLKS